MREFLFRAKKNPSGEWIEGFLVGLCHIGDWASCEPVHSNTIGEFAGLTDKKGKRIFEGDICRVTRPCVLAYGKITFKNGCFWFVDDGPGGMLRLCDVQLNGFEIEVIGNIHDNPKLAEVN